MTRALAPAVALLLGSVAAQTPVPGELVPQNEYAVYTGEGEETDLRAVVAAMEYADVVFLGEKHNDSIGHRLQLQLLESAYSRYGATRRLVLGMEMFESDVQDVLDEYLDGFITERDFLDDGRPWRNYEDDYRPLVEFARAQDVSVVATNAPGRYVSLARRRGLIALDSVTGAWPTLPHRSPAAGISRHVLPPSAAYEERFRAAMEGMAESHGAGGGTPSLDELLVAQNLRDATMAFWIGHRRGANPLFVHVNGSFHSEHRMGIPDHLVREWPAVRILVVTIRPVADIGKAPEPAEDDFLILTSKADQQAD